MVPEFNWYTEIDKVILNEPDGAEWNKLADMSKDWVTCACGQLCKRLPRDVDGEPIDIELSDLGVNFHDFIWRSDWRSARSTLDQIESRTSFLLAQNPSLLPE